MRTQAIQWMTLFLIGFLAISPGYGQEGVNLLENGGFEDGVLDPFITYGDVTSEVITEDPIEGDYCLHLSIPGAAVNYYDTGLKYPGLVFEQGKSYTLSAFFKCGSGTAQVNFKPEIDGDPYTGYGAQEFTMTNEW